MAAFGDHPDHHHPHSSGNLLLHRVPPLQIDDDPTAKKARPRRGSPEQDLCVELHGTGLGWVPKKRHRWLREKISRPCVRACSRLAWLHLLQSQPLSPAQPSRVRPLGRGRGCKCVTQARLLFLAGRHQTGKLFIELSGNTGSKGLSRRGKKSINGMTAPS